jgi:hypothetical protein
MSLRTRRMEEEWHLLEKLAVANPCILADIACFPEEFAVTLKNSPAWTQNGSELKIENEHVVRYVYPRYYPTLPLESYLVRPVAHVNVDPSTGFACLWEQYRSSQTIVDAVLITRAIMAWRAVNRDPAHQMQALDLPEIPGMQPLFIPEDCRPILRPRSNKQRLSSGDDNQSLPEEHCAFSHIE